MPTIIVSMIIFTTLTSATNSYAWGPRGHQIVTRCAVRVLKEMKMDALYMPFLEHEMHLAFLSNAPDHFWRSKKVSKRVRDLNSPTHYIDLDRIVTPLKKESVLEKLSERLVKKTTAKNSDKQGTAPQRVLQFHTLLIKQFKKLHATKKAKTMDEALTLAGLMSHFVGDLANPMHTAEDYDGWQKQQGGLHAFFESDLVSSFDLNLEGQVCEKAKMETINFLKGDKVAKDRLLTFVWESRSRLQYIFDLDSKFAIIQKSTDDKGLKTPARRRSADEVASRFKDIITERLASGSVFLAWLWADTWAKAGQPKYPGYKSYFFNHTPKFITPDY